MNNLICILLCFRNYQAFLIFYKYINNWLFRKNNKISTRGDRIFFRHQD